MKRSTFECTRCSGYVKDAQLLLVVNKKTREKMAFHKACVANLITRMAPQIRVQIKSAIAAKRSAR